MAIDVIRTRTPNRDQDTRDETVRGIIDVSDISAAAVQNIAVGQNVYLKRRGDRTYLVPA